MASVAVVELTEVKLQVAPVGKPDEQVKFTVPVKPVCGVIVMVVALLFWPATAVTDAGAGESENPGTVTVKLIGIWADAVPEVPVTVANVVPAGVLAEV
jgi:hypothetical protein